MLMEGNSKIVILRQTLKINTGRMDEISHVHLLCVCGVSYQFPFQIWLFSKSEA